MLEALPGKPGGANPATTSFQGRESGPEKPRPARAGRQERFLRHRSLSEPQGLTAVPGWRKIGNCLGEPGQGRSELRETGAKLRSPAPAGWVSLAKTGEAAQLFDNSEARSANNSEFSRTDLLSFSRVRSGAGRGNKFKREFDPGSESTLAARLTHASRARKPRKG